MDSSISDLARTYLPSGNKVSKSGTSFNCPMCTSMGESRNDTKNRGGIKFNPDGSFVYHCFNCGFATGFTPGERISNNCVSFLTTLGVPITKIPMSLRLMPHNKAQNNDDADSYEPMEFQTTTLPYGSKEIFDLVDDECIEEDFLEVIQYLDSRGEYVMTGADYYWSPSKKNNVHKRFIIPFTFKKRIVGWVGRYASDTIPSDASKYYGYTPKDYIFNIDLLNSYEEDTIILVEGVLDAIAIGGVSGLGNELSETQLKWLKRSGKRIILLPDRNKAGRRLVNQAIENGFEVSIPKWNMNLPGSDDTAEAVKKFGLLHTLESIYQAATDDKNKILMRFGIVSL